MSACRPDRRTQINAADALPHDLLMQLYAHVEPATLLWIPSLERREAQERAHRVVQLRSEGKRPTEIAGIVGVSPRRVYQVLERHREGKL